MKTFLYLLSISIMLFAVSIDTAHAQKKSKKQQKKEKKEWKKKMKSMDPMEFKSVTEKGDALAKENAALKNQIIQLTDKVDNLEAAADKVKLRETELEELKAKLKAMQDECDANTGEDYSQGIVFKVQVGAFRDLDLQEFINNGNFSGEVDADGTKKYTIGYFRQYEKAGLFKDYLRKMGVKDAWIVTYRDNQRVDVKDVVSAQK